MIIPQSILRNAVIFILALSLVLATRAVQQKVSAGTDSGAQDRYADLLTEGKDFTLPCENGVPAEKISGDRLNAAIQKYHRAVNCLFNTRIKAMVEVLLQPEGAGAKAMTPRQREVLRKNLSPPDFNRDALGQAVGRKPCAGEGGSNLSTYCLAQSAMDEYFAMRRALMLARSQARNTADQKKYGEVFEKTQRELDISRKALDQALAAYQELQLALPLHRKYLEVIPALEQYRNKVSAIRKEVDQYPETFIDVTTTQCT